MVMALDSRFYKVADSIHTCASIHKAYKLVPGKQR